MAFFVFDLDETLANVYSPFYFLGDLKPDVFGKDAEMARNKNSPELTVALEAAYKIFVRKVALSEIREIPLGVLRPGILELMSQIKRWRMEGFDARVAIYSNNGHLLMLQFIRDVIEAAIGAPGMICDCIYWADPRRAAEVDKTKVGYGQKTIKVLIQALQQGPCQAPADLKPEQIMFFDDQLHPDMIAALDWRYIHVNPHSYRAPAHLIRKYYVEALREAGIVEGLPLEAEFRKASSDMWGRNNLPLKPSLLMHANAIQAWTQKSGATARALIPYDKHASTREVFPILQRMNMFVDTIVAAEGAAAAAGGGGEAAVAAGGGGDGVGAKAPHIEGAAVENVQVGAARRSIKRRTRKSPRRGRR